jgi:AcrR family transcriptional regulator
MNNGNTSDEAIESTDGFAAGRPTVSSWFGLKTDNFILDPSRDWVCFARPDIDFNAEVEKLRVNLVTNIAPKRMYWGPYGSGKTHTLYRALHELAKLTDVRSVHIDCPDLTRKATFFDLYRDGIIRQLGETYVTDLLEAVLDQVGMARREMVLQRVTEIIGDGELAKATSRLMDPTFDKLLLWAWISGVKLGRAELGSLGLTQDLTDAEPARLAQLVVLLARLEQTLRGKRLVIVLDEMERLKDISAETIVTFVTGFTRLADPNQSDVSLLLGCSATVLTEFPDVFSPNGPVMSRIGSSNQTEIPPLPDPNVDHFIEAILAYRRVDENLQDRVREAQSQTSEALDASLYPFTREAIEALKAGLDQTITPRQITINMSEALGRAFLGSRKCIESTHVH